MRFTLCGLFVVVLFSGLVFAQKTTPGAQAQDEGSIIAKLEDQNNAAVLTGDGKALAGLYADDFIGIHARGQTTTKEHIVQYFTDRKAFVCRSEETTIRVFQDAAVVTAINVYQDRKDDDPARLRYTRIYVRRNNKWQIVSEQYTFVNDN